MADPSYSMAAGYSQGGYAPGGAYYAPYAAAAPYGGDYSWGSWGGASSRTHEPSPNFEAEPDALQSRTLYFGRLADSVTEDTLRELVAPYGDVRKISMHPEKSMAFVEYYDIRHAEAARDALRGSMVEGKKIEVQYSSVRKPDKDGNMGTLYIRPTNGSSASTSVSDQNSLDAYRRLFSSYGDIKKVSVNRKRETEKFIEYHDTRDAAKALDALNGHNFNGVTLQICFAQNASRTFNREQTSRRSRADGYGPHRSQGGYGRGVSQSPYQPIVASSGPPPAAYGPYGVCSVQGYSPYAAAPAASAYHHQPPHAAAAAYGHPHPHHHPPHAHHQPHPQQQPHHHHPQQQPHPHAAHSAAAAHPQQQPHPHAAASAWPAAAGAGAPSGAGSHASPYATTAASGIVHTRGGSGSGGAYAAQGGGVGVVASASAAPWRPASSQQ